MDYTSIKVGQLPTAEISGSDYFPHEVAGLLKKATITDLATFINASEAVGFRAVSVSDGETLPATDKQEFILVGPGTYNNVGGGPTITVTEELNALVSNDTFWFVGVEIPIDAPPGNAIWGQIIGTLSNQTDLQNILNLKADLVDGKVPSSQLPSYVDDVIEVANYAALPVTGETGKIYITIDTEYIYRWSGSAYIRIVDEAAAWGTITGTLSNQTDLQSALNAKVDKSTTITINGTTYNLSSNRTWNVGTITGSGTSDFIPKFTSGTAIGDSSVFDNGESVIIGSSGTAGSKLFIYQPSLSLDGFRSFISDASAVGVSIKATNYGSGFLFAGNNASSQVFTVANNGDITGNKFIKTGGTSSQFLKADGSVDSSTYVPTSRTITINGTTYDLSANRTWTIGGGTWGSITGTLSDQTDLQSALDLKANDDEVVHLSGSETISGAKTFSSTLTGTIFQLQPNNTSGTNSNYIGQQMATNDSWKIYGNTIASDIGELVFELGDNAISSSGNGQRFRFFYNETGGTSGGVSKSPFILDYNDATFNANATFSGIVGVNNTTPSAFPSYANQLVIGDGSTSKGITIFSGTTGSAFLSFADGTSGDDVYRGGITYNHINNSMFFRTNAANRISISDGGIVTINPGSVINQGGKFNVSNAGAEGLEFWTATTTATNMIQSYDRSASAWNSIQYKALEHIFYGSGSERMRINSSGELLINTTTSTGAKLNIVGAITSTGSVSFASDSGNGFQLVSATDNNRGLYLGYTYSGNYGLIECIHQGVAYKNIVINPNGGNVGIAITNPSYKLQLGTDSAGKPNGGSWSNSSDLRLKENIKTIKNPLDKICSLRGVTFDWIDETEQGGVKNSGGFIADEVMEVFPEWVKEMDASEKQKEIIKDDKVKSLSLPFTFDAIVVESIKELNEIIKELKAEIEILKNK